MALPAPSESWFRFARWCGASRRRLSRPYIRLSPSQPPGDCVMSWKARFFFAIRKEKQKMNTWFLSLRFWGQIQNARRFTACCLPATEQVGKRAPVKGMHVFTTSVLLESSAKRIHTALGYGTHNLDRAPQYERLGHVLS